MFSALEVFISSFTSGNCCNSPSRLNIYPSIYISLAYSISFWRFGAINFTSPFNLLHSHLPSALFSSRLPSFFPSLLPSFPFLAFLSFFPFPSFLPSSLPSPFLLPHFPSLLSFCLTFPLSFHLLLPNSFCLSIPLSFPFVLPYPPTHLFITLSTIAFPHFVPPSSTGVGMGFASAAIDATKGSIAKVQKVRVEGQKYEKVTYFSAYLSVIYLSTSISLCNSVKGPMLFPIFFSLYRSLHPSMLLGLSLFLTNL